MRIYVFEPRLPSYIEAEIAVDEYDWQGALDGRWSRTSIQSLGAFATSRKLLTRDELRAEPGSARAMVAWLNGDDGPFLAGEEQWRRGRDEETVRERAAEGCTQAKAIIEDGLDLTRADRYINAHHCSESCGGRYFVEVGGK